MTTKTITKYVVMHKIHGEWKVNSGGYFDEPTEPSRIVNALQPTNGLHIYALGTLIYPVEDDKVCDDANSAPLIVKDKHA